MTHTYRTIAWTPFKRRYDWIVGGLMLVFLATFVSVGLWLFPQVTVETLLIRGLGGLALLMLHVTLSIGPLCRLKPSFLPLLYNRRHLGILTFLAALLHGTFSIIQFHSLGNTNPLISVLTANMRWDSLAHFPFEWLGLTALLIMLLMAATSHDFWLTVLTPPGWKRLHMLVYAAYVLVALHVALGILQVEPSPVYPALLCLGAFWLVSLHLAAAWREWRKDRERLPIGADGFVELCQADQIPEGRARIGMVGSERVAVFRQGERFWGVSNLCPHQNGPLGEGAIVDGLITCPWHGFQFRPESGCAPPPYTDRVETYEVQLRGGRVWVKAQPNPPGNGSEPD